MIVLYWMTPDPVVTQPNQDLFEVVGLMRKHRIRRLPVVNSNDELCGIISANDIRRAIGMKVIGTPIPEANEKLLKAKLVESAMSSNPATCKVHDFLEEVCLKMSQEKVGAYPVLNRGHLVGIISETDLMRAVTELAYLDSGGRRVMIRLKLEQEEDALYRVVDLSRRHELELLAVLTHRILDESALIATVRVKGAKVDDFVDSLWDTGYNVITVT